MGARTTIYLSAIFWTGLAIYADNVIAIADADVFAYRIHEHAILHVLYRKYLIAPLK